MTRDPNHESRKRYEDTLGVELGSLFAELWQELAWLHTVWQEYRVIFGSPEQLAIANRAAGTFFFILQKAMLEGVLLHLARLTDPPESQKKKNLSVTALQELVKPELQVDISRLTVAAINAAKFARPWRNRYIAHKDRPLALGDEAAPPLPPASRETVEKALASLDELLNAIDRGYNDATTMFEGVESLTGARRLLEVLDKGLKAEETEGLEFRRKWGIHES